MFSVKGAHTFFMPVDTAFDVSVHVSGQDNDNLYNRGISRNVGSSIQTYQSKQVQHAHNLSGEISVRCGTKTCRLVCSDFSECGKSLSTPV